MTDRTTRIAFDLDQLLAFDDFPGRALAASEIYQSVESTFATVRNRSKITKGPGSRAAGIAMAYKLIEAAQSRLRAVNEPVDVDRATGYRRYSTDQVSTAQIIRRFRALEMPLDEIRTVMNTTDIRQRNELINAHLMRLESQLAHTKRAVESLASAHCHNMAGTRQMLWNRLAQWLGLEQR